MCGIAGEIRFDGKPATLGALERMNEAMTPRGPDAAGAWAQSGIGLAHRRLKIIDLTDRAGQPMTDPQLGLSIVFNGCIYNYKELRLDLQAKGYQFFSSGDTEVILKAYDAWGENCVDHFHGMFAFAIAERDSGRLFLARDRLGIKPLYLAETPGALRFSSFLPALIAAGDLDTDIDPVALNHYMSFHAVVPAPFTILKGVRKLPPASVMRIEPDGRRHTRVYWNLNFGRKPGDEARSFEDWRDATLEALRVAVRRRLVADVPVGVLLSGGVDSSLIVGLLAEEGQTGLNTFSVGFETVGGEAGDEFRYSDIMADQFGTKHHKISVNSRERLLPSLEGCVSAMAEPMVSHDAIGFYLLSQEVAKDLKVVQSGQGADEVFGGYHWYPPMVENNDPVGEYSRVFRDRDYAEYCDAVDPRHHGGDHSLDYITERFAEAGADDPVDKALRMDTTVMLVDDPVKRVDNMTMACGLEARVPFLDHELVELAARIPAEHKIAGEGKHVLKEASRSVIPSAVIDRPKGYFPVPALKHLQGDVLERVRDILSQPVARERGLFQPAYVDKLLAAPTEHMTPLRGSKLWQIALLEYWFQVQGV